MEFGCDRSIGNNLASAGACVVSFSSRLSRARVVARETILGCSSGCLQNFERVSTFNGLLWGPIFLSQPGQLIDGLHCGVFSGPIWWCYHCERRENVIEKSAVMSVATCLKAPQTIASIPLSLNKLVSHDRKLLRF